METERTTNPEETTRTTPLAPTRADARGPHWPLRLIVGSVVAFVAAWLARTVLGGGDWSAGARAVGTTALLLAALALVVGGALARVPAGKGRTVRLGVLILLWLAVAAGGFVAVAPLHGVQAGYSESRGLWADAVRQYTATGEAAPNAPDIARVYTLWGEHLLREKRYAEAVARFVTVTDDYAQSGDIVRRASRDLYDAYRAWIQADAAHVTYDGAIRTIASYLADPSCDATCQASAQTVAAQAHYEYGRQLAAAARYADAITQFELVQRQYAQSTYAAQARTAAATAYYALGQQQMATPATCASAVATYKTLVTQYGDSPEAATAKKELAAPQGVAGTFTGLPTTTPLPIAHLSKSGLADSYTYTNDYTTPIDGQTGAFAFTNVKQGTYYLTTTRDKGGAISYTYYTNAKGDLYKIVVGPLCTTQLGQITY